MARLISVSELAARTSTCENFWRKKIAAGELPVIRLGRNVRIDEGVVALIMECGLGRRKTFPATDTHTTGGPR